MSGRGGAGAGGGLRGRAEGGKQRDEKQSGCRSAAEWTSLGISAAIVLLLVGLVAYQQLTGGSRPPTIDVMPRLDQVRRADDAYYVPVDIANRGDLTAQDVRVRLSHASDRGRQQSSELRVDYLAGGATTHGTVVFRDDPSQGSLGVDMLSFLQP